MSRYQGLPHEEEQLRYDHRSGVIAMFLGAGLVAMPFAVALSAGSPVPWWLAILIVLPPALCFAAFRVHYHGLPTWPRRRSIGVTNGELTLLLLATAFLTVVCIWNRVGLCGQLMATALGLGAVFFGIRCHNTGLMVSAEARHDLRKIGLRAPSWPPHRGAS